jgi:hypothetical protein
MKIEEEMKEVRKKQEDQQYEIYHIRELIANLTQMQKNNVENITLLTSDVKEILKNSLVYDVIQQEIDALDKRVTAVEEGKNWIVKLILSAIIVGILTASISFNGKKLEKIVKESRQPKVVHIKHESAN